MTRLSNRKREIFIFLLLFSFILLNCNKVKAEESRIYVIAPLSRGYIHYNEVISKYGEIWIGYIVAHNRVVTVSDEERFIIEEACYYYKKDGNYVLLGSVDGTGLYDKDRVRLKAPPETASGYRIAGISSSLIEISILGPKFIIQSMTNNNDWQETESFAIIDIDTQQDTLRLMDMTMFLSP